MLAGAMTDEIDRATAEAQAGLTCLACHAIDRIHDRTGNGNYNIADVTEDPYLFASAEEGSIGAYLHDAAIKAKPTAHKVRMLQPFFTQSEFCATCHKVSLSPPINNYRWLRGQDEFDAWDDSGISLNASRTFYLPSKRRVCQDCHMPLEPAPAGDLAAQNGLVRSHRFQAANTALPFVRGDQGTIQRIEEFLGEGKLSVDVFAVSTPRLDQPVMALDPTDAVVMAGERVRIDVVVRNIGVGHTFPGGTNDSNEGWLELTVSDGAGLVLARSGALDDDGSLDPMAHVYKAVLLDVNGEPVLKRNSQDARVTLFSNVIGPGTSDVAHYEFVVPRELAGKPVTVSARLLWRKFNRAYTKFVFESAPDGMRRFSEVPHLPVSEIARDEVTISIKPAIAQMAPPTIADSVSWTRYNDYGIGLLLEGNTRDAGAAFDVVRRVAPDRVDGPLNLARTAIADGNVQAAFDYLRQCEAVAPGDARVAWIWGVVLQEDGRYTEAALAYRRVLEDFPGDRAAWRNLGRTLYLDGQYESALDAFRRVLEIDPEDRVSHYHEMLCYRALGRDSEADRAALAYEYYSVDESAQSLTRNYRLRNPGANLMTQRIRTHYLTFESVK
jgi:Flp pilus assembly protein TadD/mono/diheme cytochrome c family protein